MPSAFEITITIKENGIALNDSPLVRKVNPTIVQKFEYSKAGDPDTTTYTTLPITSIATLQGLVIRADRAVNIRLNNAGSVPLNANGMLILVDSNVAAGTSTNALINNPPSSGGAANVRGFAFGQ